MTFRKIVLVILLALLASSHLPAQEDVDSVRLELDDPDPLKQNCQWANTLTLKMVAKCIYGGRQTLSEKQVYCDLAIRAINATTKACTASLGGNREQAAGNNPTMGSGVPSGPN